ncbi:MAG: glycine--tRNA ligase [Candidatus Levybacteria bacterium]|nr:glycine--tRNA ligase [Candidatus Levybacteria bacterium]
MVDKMDKIVALAKRRGFIFPGSELYGGLANTYDYGPVGAELLRNIKNLWWETFIHRRTDIVGLDASLISHQKVWEASGHTTGFSDVLIDCKECKHRIRADHLIEDYLGEHEQKIDEFIELFTSVPHSADIDPERIKTGIANKKVEGLTLLEVETILNHLKIPCPNCGKFAWTTPRKFNLLFPVHLGIVMGDQALAYLRGETAQGMFVNFENVVNSTRVRLPFGIAQLGKSFRNEVTLGNSVFRTIEFEQGEIEYFFDPESESWEKLFDSWKESMWHFVVHSLGIREENIRWRVHTDDERSFYSKRTEDLEYNFPFGFKELWGLAYRTDYDLKQHIKHSGKELFIVDPKTNKKITPHVIEPAVGINRLFLMVLSDAYYEEGERVVLRIAPRIAPFKVAVFPLLANKEELVTKAKGIFETLRVQIPCMFDDRGNIGKRYLYQDEIGTPWCVTVDFDSLEDGTVTVRDRDTTEQVRLPIAELFSYFSKKLSQ